MMSREDWEEGCENRPDSSEDEEPNGGDKSNSRKERSQQQIALLMLEGLYL